MIESITLPVTVFSLKKWRKCVLAKRWFSVEGLLDKTLCITCWGKLHLGDTSSPSSSSFPTVKVTR